MEIYTRAAAVESFPDPPVFCTDLSRPRSRCTDFRFPVCIKNNIVTTVIIRRVCELEMAVPLSCLVYTISFSAVAHCKSHIKPFLNIHLLTSATVGLDLLCLSNITKYNYVQTRHLLTRDEWRVSISEFGIVTSRSAKTRFSSI